MAIGAVPEPDKRERDRRYNAKRPPWVAWYKTQRWRDRSRAQLKAEPWCRFHAKRGERVSASIADHVERHGGDAFKFWHGALQSLCRHCHDSTKQSLERGDRAPCGLDGLPTGPGHPWGGG